MLLTALLTSVLIAPQGNPDSGAVAFGQACLDATCDAVVLNVAAHPDDEAARTMVMMRHAYGARTVTLYTTCGGGGQNAVGREIGSRLASIRIRETLAAARHSGTSVQWLGFADFGYSKTRAETVEFWGGEKELRGRMDAAVDRVQPDIVFTNHGLARGHGHHRASAWAIREACKERGLPLFERVFAGDARIAFDPKVVDPIRGSTYAKQAHDGWREHRTQGPWSAHDPTRVRPDRWAAVNAASKRLGATVVDRFPSVFDSPAFLAELAKRKRDPYELRLELAAFADDRSRSDHIRAARVLLPELRAIHAELADDSAKTRLARRIEALERVVVIGAGITFEARLQDRNVSRGDAAKVLATLQGADVATVRCNGGAAATTKRGVAECAFEVPRELPTGDPAARLTETVRVPVRAEFELDGLPFAVERSVEVRLGPGLRASWPRDAVFVPAGRTWERVVSLEVESFGADAASQEIRFRAPEGVAVESIPARIELTRDEPRARVFVRMRGDGSTAQRFVLRATVGDAVPALLDVQPIDVEAAQDLRVALVRGPDDTVERFLDDLGITYAVLDESALAVAELADYTTLFLDIRAYHHRPDLANHRERILEFCRGGGRVLTCYHKPGEWNERKGKPLLAPFGLHVGRQRVSEEDAAVELIRPEHALLTKPHRITLADFDGWVQERGLNFPDKWDPEWERLLRMHDEGEKPLEAGLLSAPFGTGSYVYCSLALYRQLRVGHRGVARFVLNLCTP